MLTEHLRFKLNLLVSKRRYQNLASYQISKKISESVRYPRPDTQFLFAPGFLDSGKQFICVWFVGCTWLLDSITS